MMFARANVAIVYGVATLFSLLFAFIIGFIDYKVAIALVVLAIGSVAALNFRIFPVALVLFVVVDVIPFPKGGMLYPFAVSSALLATLVLSYIRGWGGLSGIRQALVVLLFFVVPMVFGYAYGRFYLGNYPDTSLSEFQCVVSWLFFPALMVCFNREGGSEGLVKFLISVAVIISIATVFQYATGFSLGGRVEQLETLGRVDSSIIRATIPGKLFVLFGLFTLTGWVASSTFTNMRVILGLVPILLMAFALLVSFGRALWVSAFLGVILTSLLLGRRQFIVVLGTILILGCFGSLLVQVINPAVADAAVERALSIFQEGASNSSYGWRVIENMFAERSIFKHPVLGVGLGGEYKPPLVEYSLFPNQTSYIHNSYYNFALKLGVGSLLIPIFFVIYFTYSGVSVIQNKLSSIEKAAVASGVSCVWAMTLLGVTQPEWTAMSSIAFLASLLALISILKLKNTLVDKSAPIGFSGVSRSV